MNEYVSLKSELWELYDSVFDGSQGMSNEIIAKPSD